MLILVDENWFLDSKYDALKKWLRGLIDSHIFKEVMKKNYESCNATLFSVSKINFTLSLSSISIITLPPLVN